jgi:hypothetical protein
MINCLNRDLHDLRIFMKDLPHQENRGSDKRQTSLRRGKACLAPTSFGDYVIGDGCNRYYVGANLRVCPFAMVIRQFRHAIRQYTAIFPIPT